MRVRRVVTTTLAVLASGYLALVGLVFVAQRRLLFPVPPDVLRPTAAVQLIELPETVLLIRPPPTPTSPVVLHFHGNGSQLAASEWRADRWATLGAGFVAVEYPGYGLARGKGEPSEASIEKVAEVALAYVRTTLGVSNDRLIVSGQSLGSGPAVSLASRGAGSKLVLFTPFTSLPDVGASRFPFLPVRWLMRDRFDSLSKTASVTQPVLIVHGTADEVVPFSHGETLAKQLTNAQLVRIEGGHHNDVSDRDDVWQALAGFVAR